MNIDTTKSVALTCKQALMICLLLGFFTGTPLNAAVGSAYEDWYLCADTCAEDDAACIDKCTDDYNDTHFQQKDTVLVPVEFRKLNPEALKDKKYRSLRDTEQNKYQIIDRQCGEPVTGLRAVTSGDNTDTTIPIPGTPFDVIIAEPCACICIGDYCICNEDCE